jgi:hypothetical protein
MGRPILRGGHLAPSYYPQLKTFVCTPFKYFSDNHALNGGPIATYQLATEELHPFLFDFGHRTIELTGNTNNLCSTAIRCPSPRPPIRIRTDFLVSLSLEESTLEGLGEAFRKMK